MGAGTGGAAVRSAGDQEHHPAEHNHRPYEQGEAEEAVAEHALRRFALRDTEYRRGEEGKEQHCRKVGGAEHYCFLPVRRLCASTAEMMLSRPATTMKRVPQSATVSWTESAPRPIARPTM